VNPSAEVIGEYSTGPVPHLDRGVAITSADGHIWVAKSGADYVARLDADGNFLGLISTDVPWTTASNEPTGVAVDHNGKVWATNRMSNSVVRIDPATDSVDFALDLGLGCGPTTTAT
jgi:DNA-binding beta-propeller fold protein YncE